MSVVDFDDSAVAGDRLWPDLVAAQMLSPRFPVYYINHGVTATAAEPWHNVWFWKYVLRSK